MRGLGPLTPELVPADGAGFSDYPGTGIRRSRGASTVWVTFVALEAGIIFGGIAIAIIAKRLADRVFVRGRVRDLDQEYKKLTAASRNS